MPTSRPLIALTLLGVVVGAVAQVPPPDAPPPKAVRPPPRRVLTERIGDGQLIEADETHIVLRIPVDPRRPGGDTRDVRVDLIDDEELRLFVDMERVKLADLKLPMAADVTRYRGTGRPPPALQSHVRVNARTPHVGGTLESVDGPTLMLSVGRDGERLKVMTDDKTRLMVFAPVPGRPGIPGRVGTLDDLKPGMWLQVHPPAGVATYITAHAPLDQIQADRAAATRPLADERDYGVVEKVDGNVLHYWSNDKGKTSVEVDGTARVSIDRRTATLAELKAEMEVVISRRATPLRAGDPTLRITATTPPVWGWIKSFDGTTLTLVRPHRLSPPSDVSVTLDDGVTVETFADYPENAKAGTRADLVYGYEAMLVHHDGKLVSVRVYNGPTSERATTGPATLPARKP